MGCFKNGHKRRNEAKTWRIFQQVLCCNKAGHLYILQAGCHVPDLQLLWMIWQRIKSRLGGGQFNQLPHGGAVALWTLNVDESGHRTFQLVPAVFLCFSHCFLIPMLCLFIISLPSSSSVPGSFWLLFFRPPSPQNNSPSSLHHHLIIHTSFFINIYLQSAGFRHKAASPPLITSDKAEQCRGGRPVGRIWGGLPVCECPDSRVCPLCRTWTPAMSRSNEILQTATAHLCDCLPACVSERASELYVCHTALRQGRAHTVAHMHHDHATRIHTHNCIKRMLGCCAVTSPGMNILTCSRWHALLCLSEKNKTNKKKQTRNTRQMGVRSIKKMAGKQVPTEQVSITRFLPQVWRCFTFQTCLKGQNHSCHQINAPHHPVRATSIPSYTRSLPSLRTACLDN